VSRGSAGPLLFSFFFHSFFILPLLASEPVIDQRWALKFIKSN